MLWCHAVSTLEHCGNLRPLRTGVITAERCSVWLLGRFKVSSERLLLLPLCCFNVGPLCMPALITAERCSVWLLGRFKVSSERLLLLPFCCFNVPPLRMPALMPLTRFNGTTLCRCR